MKYLLTALLIGGFYLISYTQSPEKRFTYTVDSIRYYADTTTNGFTCLRYEGIKPFVTIDYEYNKIKMHPTPNNKGYEFSIVEYHRKKQETNLEAFNFFCIDSKNRPYSITLALFYDGWNTPLLTVKQDGKMSVHYLKRF